MHTGFCNDLEAAAERVRPELADLRRRIAALGQPEVRMTGSGSTLFLAWPDAASAARCAERLGELTQVGVRILTTRSAGPAIDAPLPCSRPAADHGGADTGGADAGGAAGGARPGGAGP